MLSIRFDSKTEWWVSGATFARLFRQALKEGMMPARFEEWLHVADANGGLTLSQLDSADALELVAALRNTAERELQRLLYAGGATSDDAYQSSLHKLLSLHHPSNHAPYPENR